MKTFIEYKAIVEHLVKNQGKSLQEAVQEVQVPPNLKNQINDYFKAESRSSIKDNISTILKHEKNIKLCNPHLEDQSYFRDFTHFMYNERKWSKAVVENLSHTSNKLLGYLPDPHENKTFQYKGLVVGHIQSGKTSNMSSLIARAADQGYRFFIILSGRYKDLRLQTQNRIDQDITGESEIEFLPCVEHESDTPKWNRMTKACIDGDFKIGTTKLDPNHDTPKVAVIKKNTKVMEQLIQYLKQPTVSLKNFSALIIDDECDDASININYADDEDDPSKTNQKSESSYRFFQSIHILGLLLLLLLIFS